MLTHSTLVKPAARVGLVVCFAWVVTLKYWIHEVDAGADCEEDVNEEYGGNYTNNYKLISVTVARNLQGSIELSLQPLESHK